MAGVSAPLQDLLGSAVHRNPLSPALGALSGLRRADAAVSGRRQPLVDAKPGMVPPLASSWHHEVTLLHASQPLRRLHSRSLDRSWSVVQPWWAAGCMWAGRADGSLISCMHAGLTARGWQRSRTPQGERRRAVLCLWSASECALLLASNACSGCCAPLTAMAARALLLSGRSGPQFERGCVPMQNAAGCVALTALCGLAGPCCRSTLCRIASTRSTSLPVSTARAVRVVGTQPRRATCGEVRRMSGLQDALVTCVSWCAPVPNAEAFARSAVWGLARSRSPA